MIYRHGRRLLRDTPGLTALQQAWIEEAVVQCGYCQPGQVMTAGAAARRPAAAVAAVPPRLKLCFGKTWTLQLD